MSSILMRFQASFNAEEAVHGQPKSEDDTLMHMQQLELLVKDYKATVSALESELNKSRAHPVIAEDTEAKKKLLAEVETARAAAGAAEKGVSTRLSYAAHSLTRYEFRAQASRG